MRMLDVAREQPVRVLQLYLTAKEARHLLKGLTRLVSDPEAKEHEHIFAEDMSREMSFSIITEAKWRTGGYTPLEQRVFDEK